MSSQLAEAKLRAFRAGQLFSATIELTYACNWRCVFCFNPRHFDLKGLTAAQWAPVFDDLRSLGALSVTVTGGEPLAHPQFSDILKALRDRYFTVRLYTNGALIDDEIADLLAEQFVSAVEMSLHGATAEIHDAATQRPGSFKALMTAVSRTKSRGLDVLLKTPLTRLNEHQIDAMIDLAESLSVRYQIDEHLSSRDGGDLSPLQYSASPAGLKRVIELGIRLGTRQLQQRPAGGYNCGVGTVSLSIDPEGNVFPCHQWRHRALGNVRETRLLDLWPKNPVRDEALAASRAANELLSRSGDVLANEAFCPALAFEQTGSPLSLYPSFVRNAEIGAEVREELRSTADESSTARASR